MHIQESPVRWYHRFIARWVELVYGFWVLWPMWVGAVVTLYVTLHQKTAATGQMWFEGLAGLFCLIQIIWFFVADGLDPNKNNSRHDPVRPVWYWRILARADRLRKEELYLLH